MTCELKAPLDARPALRTSSARCEDRLHVEPHVLDPNRLPDHIDRLYRAACALCGSRQDAEDLVQETFASVLKRPRLLRDHNEIGYLLRVLRNTHINPIGPTRSAHLPASCSKMTRPPTARTMSTRAKSCRQSQAPQPVTETR